MAVLKEWRCAAHGSFEGTHPICPHMGCLSASVEREFRTPVAISQGKYARFDRGMRRTADSMGISNWNSSRPGEVSFAGRGTEAPLGTQVLWGNEVAKHPEMGGRSFANLAAAAQTPLSHTQLPNVSENDPFLRVNSGMRAAATTLGLTKSVLPPAERIAPLVKDAA